MASDKLNDTNLEDGLLTVVSDEKRTLMTNTPTSPSTQTPRPNRMARACRLTATFAVCLFIGYGLTSAVVPSMRCTGHHAHGAAAGPPSLSESQMELSQQVAKAVKAAEPESLHRLVEAYIHAEVKEGESVQEDLSTAGARLARRQDNLTSDIPASPSASVGSPTASPSGPASQPTPSGSPTVSCAQHDSGARSFDAAPDHDNDFFAAGTVVVVSSGADNHSAGTLFFDQHDSHLSSSSYFRFWYVYVGRASPDSFYIFYCSRHHFYYFLDFHPYVSIVSQFSLFHIYTSSSYDFHPYVWIVSQYSYYILYYYHYYPRDFQPRTTTTADETTTRGETTTSTTRRPTSSSAVVTTRTSTEADGDITLVTETSYVGVEPTAQATSDSNSDDADLQNAAPRMSTSALALFGALAAGMMLL
ncbi:UPF0364 protein [Verticillium dahliae VDG1]|nr:UPF0364 protein [Verticillium dahliae VDG1]